MSQVKWTLIAPAAAEELLAVHRAAVARGVDDTGSAAETERLATPLQLLSLTVQRLPDLALGTFVLQSLGGGPWDRRLAEIVAQMRSQSAGAIRLCQRAIEVHARDVGYDARAWNAGSVETASALLHAAHGASHRREPSPTPIAELREASRLLACAIRACERDRMAFPEYLSGAIGRLLLLFMLATELEARHR